MVVPKLQLVQKALVAEYTLRAEPVPMHSQTEDPVLQFHGIAPELYAGSAFVKWAGDGKEASLVTAFLDPKNHLLRIKSSSDFQLALDVRQLKVVRYTCSAAPPTTGQIYYRRFFFPRSWWRLGTNQKNLGRLRNYLTVLKRYKYSSDDVHVQIPSSLLVCTTCAISLA